MQDCKQSCNGHASKLQSLYIPGLQKQKHGQNVFLHRLFLLYYFIYYIKVKMYVFLIV